MPSTLRFLLAILVVSTLSAAARAGDYPVSDWRLTAIDGTEVSFHESLDRGPVLVSFWALWCGPCLKEMPHLEKIAEDFDGELSILALNVDTSRSVHKVSPYVAAKGYEHVTVLLDTAGDVQRVLQTTGTMPFLILFDADGRELYRHTGYREGDELKLREQVEAAVRADAATSASAPQDRAPGLDGLQITNQFEYSYSTDTKREIVENWLDAAWTQGGLRLGFMLNNQQPGEEASRRNDLRHRFVSFTNDDVSVRAGHFYGMFGRGLIFHAYEDRVIRIDTALDGVKVDGRRGRWRGTVFTGTPFELETDVRGTDHTLNLGRGLKVGASALTWQDADPAVRDGALLRDWARAFRLEQDFAHGSFYGEYASRSFHEETAPESREWEERDGHAAYLGLNLHHGALGVSLEGKDYENFTILDAADGRRPLNNVPNLTREHLFTLLNRHPYLQDADDARGFQAEVNWSAPGGWTVLLNTSRVENQDGDELFSEWYGQLDREELFGMHPKVGYDRREADGLELDTVVGEFTLPTGAHSSWVLKAEHQHVRDTGNAFGDLGSYDQQFFSLEYATAPHWSVTAMIETNNKYAEQRDFLEEAGPFAAAQVSYLTGSGDLITVWAGERLGGYLCAGGVCKWEPAFKGVEIFGTLRY